MKYITLCVTLIALLQTAQAQMPRRSVMSYDPDKTYRVEELHFDLAILREALVKTHPGLFWHQPEKEFEENYTRIKNSVKRPMTEMQFFTILTPFVGNIRCGHTDPTLSKAFYKDFFNTMKIFPFEVRIVESKVYIDKNYTTDTNIAAGSQIISINGIGTDSILRFLKPFAWADGFTESYRRCEFFFQSLLLNFFNYPDKYVLNIIDQSGNRRSIDIEALNSKICDKNYSKRNTDKKHKPFRLHLVDSLSTAIIRIDEFLGRGYEKFLSKSFKTIRNKRVKAVVIDLRRNGGGSDYYGRLLYQYIALKEFKYYDRLEVAIDNPKDTIFKYGKRPLKFYYALHLMRANGDGKYDLKNVTSKNLRKEPFKPYKNNFAGDVFVLIDNDSFSATSEFCAVAHYNKRAKFAGRETGGGYCGNTSGTAFELILPKTKIEVEIPVIKYYVAVKAPCGRGIEPDYPLNESVSLDKDSDLLFVLNLIKRSKN
jgi:hypothetical protein